MIAGLNKRATIWRISFSNDAVGGAIGTGTPIYENIPYRMQADPEEQLLLQQGLETRKTFTAVVQPGNLAIQERDEFEPTFPDDDPHYGKRFRIISFRYSSHNNRDPRKYIMLSLIRTEKATREQ